MMVADVVVAKKFSREWIVRKISVANRCGHITIPKKILGISWQPDFSGEIYCQVNSIVAMVTTPVAGVSLVFCNARPPVT